VINREKGGAFLQRQRWCCIVTQCVNGGGSAVRVDEASLAQATFTPAAIAISCIDKEPP
jgi:hypothetical protein